MEINRYLNYLKSSFSKTTGINFLILYLTSKCNLSCQTCFFHNRLNRQDDLRLEEYQKIASASGKFSILLLSGGEPFLNENIIEICASFIKQAGVNSLLIPTNGILTDKIIDNTEILLKSFPQVSISINPSLDGLADYHDRNRGMVGTFAKAIETIKQLEKLKLKYSNLQIVVNSVMADNLDDLKKLMLYLRQFNLDFHSFELIRGDRKNKNLGLPPLNQIKEFHKLIIDNRFWYLNKKLARNKRSFFAWLEKIAVVGVLKLSQKFKELAFGQKPWPLNCRAGRDIAVIYPDGQTALCELKFNLGNVREVDYNLNRLLSGQAAAAMKQEIKKTKCACTHSCFVHATLAARPNLIKSFLSVWRLL